LTDRVTGELVEVDVCIETRIAGDDVIVSVECTKKKRRAGVGWVNEMIGKHQRLPTKLLVLASGSGFVKNAKAAADAAGVKLISMSTVSEATVRGMIGSLEKADVAVTRLSVKQRLAYMKAAASLPAMVLRADRGTLLYDADGKEVKEVGRFCDSIVESSGVLKAAGRQNDIGNPLSFQVEWKPKPDAALLHFQKTDSGELHPIERLVIEGEIETRTTQLSMQNASLDRTEISWGDVKMPFSGQDLVIVKTTDEAGVERISATSGDTLLPIKTLTRGDEAAGVDDAGDGVRG
jgi:hypothetical protein